MNRITRIILPLFVLVLLTGAVPLHSFAAATSTGLVTCGQAGPLNANGTQACGFPQLIQLITNILDFLIFVVAPAIMVCVILYAGFLYLTSLGSPEARSKANGMFVKAVTGMAIAMVAWILIKFILEKLGVVTSVFPVFY